MANQWEKFFQDIVDETGKLIKDEVKEMLDSAREDSEVFLKRQAKKPSESHPWWQPLEEGSQSQQFQRLP